MQLNQNNTPLVANQYTYDAMSRLATVSDGSNTATYGRISGSNLLNTTTITAGGVTKLTTTRNYDAQNRLTSISSVSSVPSVVKTYSYTYDANDRRSRLDMADGSYWLYTYDTKGQIASGAKYDSTNKAIPGQAFGYAYDDIGNLTTEQRGMTEMQFDYTSNLVNQYTQRLVPGIIPVTGQASADSTVSVWLKNHGANAAAVTRPIRDGEYFKAAIPVNNTAANVTEALEITAVKFNTTLDKDVVKTINGTYTVPKTPQLFTNDDDGDMTGDGVWTYTWNGENRLIVAESADKKLEFAYDYKGRMIYRKAYTVSSGNWALASTDKYVWDGFNQIAICNASDNLQKSMLWGEDINGGFQTAGGVGGLLAVNAPIASKTYLPCYDGNGNVMAYVDSADGSLAAEYEYSPSPVIISKNGPKADELAAIASFSTKPYDKDLDAFFYQFRILKYGRWLSRDPIEEKGGVNLYCFLQNNVSDSVDILGLIDITNIPGIMTANQWTHGAALMKHWFDSTGKNDTTTVTMDWVLGYARARDVYDNIINEKVYVNDAAKQQIIALAKKKGVYKKGGSFGSTSGDVETLDKDYIQYRAVGSILDPIDDLNTALGTFVFRIIVEGSVKGRGYHHCFTISKIGIYVRDSYDFKGDQFLGFWNDKTNYGGRNWFKGESVSNKDFRDYTAKTGKGKDFIVFSNINSIGFKVSEFFEEQGK